MFNCGLLLFDHQTALLPTIFDIFLILLNDELEITISHLKIINTQHFRKELLSYRREMLPLTLTCQLAWQTVQMGKQFAHGQEFEQLRDPVYRLALPGALRGEAEGP